MDSFQYFRVCSHEFVTIPATETREEFIFSKGELEQVLSESIMNGVPTITLIDNSSIPSETPPEEMYYDSTNYSFDETNTLRGYYDIDINFYHTFPTSNITTPIEGTLYEILFDRIVRWKVRPPISYKVIYQIRPKTQIVEKKSARDCPRCDGFNWYLDITDIDGSFSGISGIDKVAQRVIKDLLTDKEESDFDIEYGSSLVNFMYNRSPSVSEQQLYTEISSIVSDTERIYLQHQINVIDSLSDDEILIRLGLYDIYRSEQEPTKVVMDIFVETRTNAQTLRIPIG
jgi:hypothetical protein